MPYANKEDARRHAREYYHRHRERLLAYCKTLQASDPVRLQLWRAKARAKYRSYPPATRPCPEVCECCGIAPKQALCIDHCHATGVFRGWLCHGCNVSIGRLGDNVEGVRRAIRYLEKRDAP